MKVKVGDNYYSIANIISVKDKSVSTETVTTKDTSVGSDLFILPLPQSELDGNENISDADQNPIVQ